MTNKDRLKWMLIGALLTAGVTVATGLMGPGNFPTLTDEERAVLIREKFTPVEIVKEIRVPVEIKVPVHVPVREVVTIRVPGKPVEVIRTVEAPGDCPPVGPVVFSGGCQGLVAGRGADLYATGRWWAEAKGNGWVAADQRDLEPGEIEWEISREAVSTPKWQKRWWAGAVRAGGWGPMLGFSIERRRWSLLGAAGVAFDVDRASLVDQSYWLPEAHTEPVGLVMVSRK